MFRCPSSALSHQSSTSVTTIHTYQSFQSCGHRFLCTDSNGPFTPVRQTIRRPLQSSVVRFSQNRSGRKYERPPSPSSVVRHPSSVKIGPGAILADDGWRMRTINRGNELWIGNSPQIIPLSTTFPDCRYTEICVHSSEKTDMCEWYWLKRTTDDWGRMTYDGT